MDAKAYIRAAMLAAACLMAACGGGTSVRLVSDPPPPTAPPPPPSPGPGGEPCPAPISGDCLVDPPVTLTFDEFAMTGGRDSDFRLFVTGPGGWLNLKDGEYRFAGGTEVAGASLVVWDTLVSDVKVLHDFTGLGFDGTSEFWLTGTLRGNLVNEELVTLRHRCGTSLNLCVEDRHPRIDGDFTQGPTGTLAAVFGWDLQVSGMAALDGQLVLLRGTSQSYVLPDTPSSVLVLHADDGVSGRFAGWRAESLFLTGELRYTGNDVFFDATRVALSPAIAAAGVVEPMALQGARQLDRAFERTDPYLGRPIHTLEAAQQRFLGSAAAIQHIDDPSQAARSLASLAGHAHVLAGNALHRQVADTAAQLEARLGAQDYQPQAQPWATGASGAGPLRGWQATNRNLGGVDLWAGPRLVVGAGAGEVNEALQFDRNGGAGVGQSPLAVVYARYGADAWYVGGLAGAARTELRLARTLDLASAGERTVRSRRLLGQVFAHVEAGTRLAAGAGTLAPYLALDYSAIRAGAFAEQGDTGLELVAGAARSRRLSAATGLRYSHAWWPDTPRWLRLDVDARYTDTLAHRDHGPQAAFAGAPDARFVLAAPDADAGTRSVGLVLNGGLQRGWRWHLDYSRVWSAGAGYRDAGWSAGLHRPF